MKHKYLIWLHNNLFLTWPNALFTIVSLVLIFYAVPPILNWTIFNANFVGSGPEACTSGGACWVFVRMRFDQFMYGFYPRDLIWRINLSYVIFIVAALLGVLGPKLYRKWAGIFLLFIFPIIAFYLYKGGIFGLEPVDTYSWGGLHLTLVIAVISIICSLPIGILLALGRRSPMPIIRAMSIMFIELWRGVPLISVLFMASVLIPIFFSGDVHFDKVLRALIGITLFYSAYMAEVVRGGLDALPKAQSEAAQALGFRYIPSLYLIILPQAIKIVIPGIVNNFIGLFKDTTLILIVGLFDFLGMVQAANEDPRWIAYGLEGYVFAAFVYWLFCFLMSRYSVYLEHKLNVGHKL